MGLWVEFFACVAVAIRFSNSLLRAYRRHYRFTYLWSKNPFLHFNHEQNSRNQSPTVFLLAI